MIEEFVSTTAGRTAVYRNIAETDTIPIIFLHGGPGHPNARKVDDFGKDFLVLTYDQIGCGKSDRVPQYDVNVLTEHLKDVIQSYKFEEFILAGGSWGAGLACAYLDRYGTDGLMGLALTSPFLDQAFCEEYGLERISKFKSEANTEIKRCLNDKEYGEELALLEREFFLTAYSYKGSLPFADWGFGPPNEVNMEMFGPSELKCTGNLLDFDVTDVLKTIDVSVFFALGDNDIIPEEEIERYASLTKESELHIYKDTGHIFMGDVKEQHRKDLLSYFRRILKLPNASEYPSEDFDMIVESTGFDTISRLNYFASIMNLPECLDAAEKHLYGLDVPESPYSGLVFATEAMNKELRDLKKLLNKAEKPYNREYSENDPERKTCITPRGFECTCCSDMRKMLKETWTYNENGIVIIDRGCENNRPFIHTVNLDSCPYCNANISIIENVECSGSTNLAEKLMNENSIESSLKARSILRKEYQTAMENSKGYEMVKECKKRIRDIETELSNNITGKLTRSSIGYESFCCNKFANNFEGLVSTGYYDGFYDLTELKNLPPSQIYACPYCGERVKRVPRHY